MMDLFNISLARGIGGGGGSGGSVTIDDIPNYTISYYGFRKNGNSYVWDDQDLNLAQDSMPIPLYITNDGTYVPTFLNDGEVHYQYVDVVAKQLHYLVFQFGVSTITLQSENVYDLSPFILQAN